MATNLAGADLEALTQLQRKLHAQANSLRSLTSAATAGTAALELVWEGPDSAAFKRQWMTVHRRKLNSAVDELKAAAETIERNRQAQEQTSAADGPGGFSGNGSGLNFSGASPLVSLTSEGGDGTGRVPQGDPAETGLVSRPPTDVFNEDYMEAHIGSHNAGENDPELNRLMLELLNDDGSDPEALNARLDEVAEIRGVDPAEFRAQHELYLELAEQSGPIDDLENLDASFVGSTTSLRYGQVVGDVLGIDPVFAALLNPSGGQVGGGNLSYTPGDNDAIGYHGTFHDAAGYLYNHHDELGPGYDYLGREGLNTESPITGQVAGISWWAGNHPELDADASQVADIIWEDPPPWAPVAVDVLHRVGFEEAVGEITHVAEGGVDIYQGSGEILDGNFTDGLDQIYNGGSIIVDGTVDKFGDFSDKQIENAQDAIDAAVDGGEYIYDRAVDGGEYIYDRAVDGGEYIVDTGGDILDSAVDVGGGIADIVTDPIDILPGLGGLLG